MTDIKNKLLKNQIISFIIGIFFFIVTDTITRYIAGGFASCYGFPFTYHYDYWFAPGIEFECSILLIVNFVLFCLFFMLLGLIYLTIREKKRDFRRNYIKFLSVMILFLVFFSIVGFLICPFPDISGLPKPGEYVHSGYVTFLDSGNMLVVSSKEGPAEIRWNDTLITVDGNVLEWNSSQSTWAYENVKIFQDSYILDAKNNGNIIDVSDRIINCIGNITIKYIPTDVTFGTWNFS